MSTTLQRRARTTRKRPDASLKVRLHLSSTLYSSQIRLSGFIVDDEERRRRRKHKKKRRKDRKERVWLSLHL